MSSNSAYTYALRLLTKRDYSRAKLRDKLLQRDFGPEEVDETLDELIQKNYLREDYYAEARVKGLMHKGYSPSMIQYRLGEEGCPVTSEFIDHIYGEYKLTSDDQIAELIDKKIRRLPSTHDLSYEAKQKIVASVARKGHSPSAIFRVLEQVLSQSPRS